MNDSPSRRRCSSASPASAAEEAACAKKIISTLARRAYRRPVTDDDLQTPLARYRDGATAGRLRVGRRAGAPQHPGQPELPVPLRESAGDGRAEHAVSHQRSGAGVAAVVLPVEQHSRRRTAGRRGEEDAAQSRRAASSRSSGCSPTRARRRWSSNFAGQWLHIRNVAGLQPSPEMLFHFDDNLRQAFEQETELFFDSIMRENRSVLDLLDADYTFLNERLAKHYGIPGVYGERFRRVSLPADSARRGLLGQGSILMATSRANRTSPVIRGKWILENIFGAPPPPPPPNVPDLKDERDPRRCCRCASRWRSTAPIRSARAAMRRWTSWGLRSRTSTRLASGATSMRRARRSTPRRSFPTARSSTGPAELRKVLLSHSDEFLTTAHREAADLCARAGARSHRCAGGPPDQARGRARRTTALRR